jgi:hypothetical protein
MFLRDNGEIGGFAMCKEHLKKKKKIGKKSHAITSRNNQRRLTLHPFKII